MENLEDHFGERIQLPPETSEAILEYLTRGAAEFTESKVSIKILDSIGEKTQLRVSTIPYNEKQQEHDDECALKHPSIGANSNCFASNQGEEGNGLIDQHHVEYPEEYENEIEEGE